MELSERKKTVKLDLTTISILIVEDKSSEQDILSQILMGFGVRGVHRCYNAEEAMKICKREPLDLCFVDATLKPVDGYELVKNLRREQPDRIKQLQTILVCGHVRRSDVFKARDCGSNFIVSKPLSPKIIFDRIAWLARDGRGFVECDAYIGPDRRIRSVGPPADTIGRRHDDLSEEVGEATEDNMSQRAVDDFFTPQRVSL